MITNRVFKCKKAYHEAPILDLDLSVRLINGLRRTNVFRLRQLNGKSEEELLEMFQGNKRSIKEIFFFSDEARTEITIEGERISIKFDSSFEGIDIYLDEKGQAYTIQGEDVTVSPTLNDLYFILTL